MDWGDVPSWLGVAGAAGAFGIGLWQYVTAQAWKRAEFVSAEMKAFFGDPQVATALTLIDYSVIRLNQDGKLSKTGWEFNDAKLVDSLAVHTKFVNEIEKFSDDEFLARMAFDALLTGLERFDHYLQANLITLDNLKIYLAYWIDKMGNPSSGWKEPPFYVALHGFVRAYEYRGVQHLFTLFTISPPTLPAVRR